MAEQFTRNEQVVGSIPTISSKNPFAFADGFLLVIKTPSFAYNFGRRCFYDLQGG